MFGVVLVEPCIAPNTGNVIRLCANTGCELHLVEPLGFRLEDRQLKRAGLDYHEYAKLVVHPSWPAFLQTTQPKRWFALTTKGQHSPYATNFQAGDWLVFGSEVAGLSADIRQQCPVERQLRLPMLANQRSLNLSNAVAVCVFEAWRQLGFAGAAG